MGPEDTRESVIAGGAHEKAVAVAVHVAAHDNVHVHDNVDDNDHVGAR